MLDARAKYALTAFAGALAFSVYLAFWARVAVRDYFYDDITFAHRLIPLAVVFIGPALATTAAWFVFPIGTRSVQHMARKGVAVVAVTTMLGPLAILLINFFTTVPELATPFDYAQFWFWSIVAGNLLTALSVWPAGIFLSFLHAEPLGDMATK